MISIPARDISSAANELTIASLQNNSVLLPDTVGIFSHSRSDEIGVYLSSPVTFESSILISLNNAGVIHFYGGSNLLTSVTACYQRSLAFVFSSGKWMVL